MHAPMGPNNWLHCIELPSLHSLEFRDKKKNNHTSKKKYVLHLSLSLSLFHSLPLLLFHLLSLTRSQSLTLSHFLSRSLSHTLSLTLSLSLSLLVPLSTPRSHSVTLSLLQVNHLDAQLKEGKPLA